MVGKMVISHKWVRSDVRSGVATEILRCAQNDRFEICHSERSEVSPATYG